MMRAPATWIETRCAIGDAARLIAMLQIRRNCPGETWNNLCADFAS